MARKKKQKTANPPGTEPLSVSMDPRELEVLAESDRAFVAGNQARADRERWVGEQWLRSRGLGTTSMDGRVVPGGDPPDLLVDGAGVEVVIAMEDGRKQGDEYRVKHELAARGETLVRWLDLATVRDHGHEWILQRIAEKAEHYSPEASKAWILLVYANFGWGGRAQYELIERNLAASAPPFAAVEVLYCTGDTHGARRVFTASAPPAGPA